MNLEISASAVKVFNGVATLVWIVAVPIVLLSRSLQQSVPLLVFVSLYANIVGHFSAYVSGRVEAKQEEGETK